jgi:hypothetical protein
LDKRRVCEGTVVNNCTIARCAGRRAPLRPRGPFTHTHGPSVGCPPSGYAPKVLELALDFFGPERVLFGSDAPFDVQDGRIFIAETLRSIEAMAVPPDTRAAILAKQCEADTEDRIISAASL